MVFSSITFLYYFLPAALLLYFAVPQRLKNTVLFFTSLIFYGWGEPRFVLVMLLAILQGYLFGMLIGHGYAPKACLAISVSISLGLLGYCKYADFFIENLNSVTGLSIPLLHVTLPIGISFYTFQILSYVIDVYRGDVPAQQGFIDLAAYIAMFPQLIAGPIVRYHDISAQLKNRAHSFSRCALGIRRFVIGLGKKVLFANNLGELCQIFRGSGDKSIAFFWLYSVANALHIYYDFSGYSDMAIGLGKIFGFNLPENFNYPYISKSITEFWRRWHMSLGTWFRDYVYIPLGGNRVKKPRWLCNLMIVWFLTGFWHGAAWNFIIWGLSFGVLLVMEKLWIGKILEKAGFLGHIYVILAVLLSFVVFQAASIPEALFHIRAMFGAEGFCAVSVESTYYLKSYAAILLAALLGSTPIPSRMAQKLRDRQAAERALNLAEPLFLLMLMCLITGYIVDGSFNPFLYFRF